MTQLTAALDAELRKPSPTIFGAVTIALPDYNLNLLDGAGRLTFGGKTYVGRDATYGTLSAMENLADGMGSEAPRISMTLLPSGDAAAADLAGPEMQGSLVSVYLGAVVPETGQVVPDPHLIFLGELDVPTISGRENSREIDYEVASIFERFFSDDEGTRLAPGFHKSIWPGELGLDFVTAVEQGVFWGVERPQGGVSYGGGVPGGGGGGGFASQFVREF